MCVCVCVCVCVVWRGGGGGGNCVRACVSVCTRARGCVLTIHRIGTADAEILSTQRIQVLSLLRNDVQLDFLCTL